MPGQFPILFSDAAFSDLDEIQTYYQNEGVPDIGKKLIAEIIEAIERLSAFPLSGRVVPEFNIEKLREIIHPPFRIVYHNDRKRIRIVRIWRSERLLKLP